MSSCAEGLLQIQRMFAVTHRGVPRWRGRRRAAERSRLRSASVHAVHQGHGPKLTVLVVKKRISSRFFALLNARLSDPPPGTVIDAKVT
ncbi:piwi-like protein 1 isoform X3 [Ictalurus punctatus]|uniref:Piwi-like protein 1 isoform X3 n=1 Tax=Ictalurus punctatus TaxID=7998 RepID=A0A9F7R2Q7_ICTPU|nr:piwi-like protein 1 isoform X3 [Ictalurus punctatus]